LYFHLHALRFSFIARETIHFGPGKSANILRGALGAIFRRIACLPTCPGAKRCEFRVTCPYARTFEPAAIARGPSGLHDWPRPFVFRAIHLDGLTFEPGTRFHFDLNLFDTQSNALTHFVFTFAQLAHDGLGPGRAKVELVSVERLDHQGSPCATIYENGALVRDDNFQPLTLDLSPATRPVTQLCVRFVTPTELKSGEQLAAEPGFAILAARIRDRLSTLQQLYGSGPLDIDFRAFAERAARVRMTHCDVKNIGLTRRSSRTGRTHPIGGFVGEAGYEGDLAEFLPYLRAAKWTGVGRQTVWGKGEIEVR
jgi:hypothetical protein